MMRRLTFVREVPRHPTMFGRAAFADVHSDRPVILGAGMLHAIGVSACLRPKHVYSQFGSESAPARLAVLVCPCFGAPSLFQDSTLLNKLALGATLIAAWRWRTRLRSRICGFGPVLVRPYLASAETRDLSDRRACAQPPPASR